MKLLDLKIFIHKHKFIGYSYYVLIALVIYLISFKHIDIGFTYDGVLLIVFIMYFLKDVFLWIEFNNIFGRKNDVLYLKINKGTKIERGVMYFIFFSLVSLGIILFLKDNANMYTLFLILAGLIFGISTVFGFNKTKLQLYKGFLFANNVIISSKEEIQSVIIEPNKFVIKTYEKAVIELDSISLNKERILEIKEYFSDCKIDI